MTTILFETITAASLAYNILQPLIDVTNDCNAVTYDSADEELVKWLIKDKYCQIGARSRVYLYLVNVTRKSPNSTLYQYQDLQIEQIFIPPADWEFITLDSQGKIVDKTWWGYEDGLINIGIYIENFLSL